MDLLEEYYGKQTFTLYALFANVPGKKVWPRRIFLTLSILLLSLATIFQIMKFVIDGLKFRLIIDLMPTTATTLCTLLFALYVPCAMDRQHKEIFSLMLKDLKRDKPEGEDALKRHYAKTTENIVNKCTIVFVLAVCGMPLTGFIPCFLNVIIPLNQTREKELLFDGEMFIDQEEYFYYIYFVECCVFAIVVVIIGITENMGLIIGRHYCSMCAAVGYHLKNVTRDEEHAEVLENGNCADSRVRKRLVNCIKQHHESLEFAVHAARLYDIPLTFTVIGTFCTLTVSLVHVTDPQLISMKIIISAIIQIFLFFIINCMGQAGTDMSEEIRHHAYNAQWYEWPPRMRKSLQLIILRSSRPCKIIARYVYTLSIENFLLVIRTVTSCYMVLRQV